MHAVLMPVPVAQGGKLLDRTLRLQGESSGMGCTRAEFEERGG